MKYLRIILKTAVCILFVLVTSCSGKEQHSYPPAEVADLSSLMYRWTAMDSADRADSLAKYLPETMAFMQTLTDVEITPEIIGNWASSLAVARFTPPVDSVFPSREPLREVLGNILGAAKEQKLDLPHRRYAAVVWGRRESVLFVDSVMLIALNHYLGPEFEGYSRWPVYRRMDKSPARLPYDIAESLVGTSYPYKADAADATLLSRMLYHGALAYAVMQLVPDADEAVALGYNAEDYQWIKANENDIWSRIVAEKLLYDTSEAVGDRFVLPSPAVRCGEAMFPGRIGRYIGYRIVEAYMDENPGTTLPELLSPDFYNTTAPLAFYGK